MALRQAAASTARIPRRSWGITVLLLVGLTVLSGCETVRYYHQAATGQWRLLSARQDLDQVIANPATPEATRTQLVYVQRVLEFADQTLGLASRGRYESYVALAEPHVVWNVFAAPQSSLQGYQWCYPIVGCAPYRGFFRQADAEALATKLAQEQGYETFVGGVAAYSTLGWFDDPVLSTFAHWPQADLAALLFHELTHGRIWIKGDVRFNESLASFVAQQALREWHQAGGVELDQWRSQAAEWHRMRSLLLQLKAALNRVFEQTGSVVDADEEVRQQKTYLYAEFGRCFEANRALLGGERFDRLVSQDLNNAYLVSLGTYEDLSEFFANLFDQSGGDWSVFWQRLDTWAEGEGELREAALAQFAEQQERHQADGHDPDQIHCQALSGHGRDTETAG